MADAALRPARWLGPLVGKRRPLFVREGPSSRQSDCIEYLANGRWRSGLGRWALKASKVMRKRSAAPVLGDPSPAALVDLLSARIPEAATSCAGLVIGPRGPLQKATALLLDRQGAASSLVKVALASSADPCIHNEASWLNKLTDRRLLQGCVPRLRDTGVLTNGRAYLAQSVGPIGKMTTQYTSSHTRFLMALGQTNQMPRRIAESDVFQRLQVAVSNLRERIDASASGEIGKALEECQERLSVWDGPTAWAHRDFTAWNIRRTVAHIFVYDWEYACEDANPLQDVLHFHLSKHAVSRKGVTLSALAAALASSSRFASHAHPEYRWTVRVIKAHALLYLLDVLLFYAAADGDINWRDPIVHNYWGLMMRRNRWM